MNYKSFTDIINSADTNAGVTYLKTLWYQKQEGYYNFNDYRTFLNHYKTFQLYAPPNWNLLWDGNYFSISKKIYNHGTVLIKIDHAGELSYNILP
ncbi:hypothetical protein [Bacillus sp. Marseille-P3661]|uniref:hypothetical protein n=1 Tax=Bacillus sp. Marseille-P3661 TaxID=1936234 RepID=UPI000C8494CC|nr:hypothetical protein [Bacillus sp. Marseille-P3661]